MYYIENTLSNEKKTFSSKSRAIVARWSIRQLIDDEIQDVYILHNGAWNYPSPYSYDTLAAYMAACKKFY